MRQLLARHRSASGSTFTNQLPDASPVSPDRWWRGTAATSTRSTNRTLDIDPPRPRSVGLATHLNGAQSASEIEIRPFPCGGRGGILTGMARIIGGIGVSHTPTIGYARARDLRNDPPWQRIFQDFDVVRDWLGKRDAAGVASVHFQKQP